VFCCVGNDDDLRSVALAAGWRVRRHEAGAVFIDHTTASARRGARALRQSHGRRPQFVEAPVSGGQAGAQNGMLTVMCGGEASAFEAAKPAAMAFARAFTLLGGAGSGSWPRWSTRSPSAGWCRACRKRSPSAEKAGLDMTQVLDVIGKGAAQSWQMDNRARP
jgi:3-hydroxyisobutyrate dehydrogenase